MVVLTLKYFQSSFEKRKARTAVMNSRQRLRKFSLCRKFCSVFTVWIIYRVGVNKQVSRLWVVSNDVCHITRYLFFFFHNILPAIIATFLQVSKLRINTNFICVVENPFKYTPEGTIMKETITVQRARYK